MGRTYKTFLKANQVQTKMQRKYGGKFVVRKLYGRYIVKRPNYRR